MNPFLAIFVGNPGEQFSELQNLLEKNTPVDFLFITPTTAENNTYRYSTSHNLSQEIKEIENDYPAILLVGKEATALFKSTCDGFATNENLALWVIDPDQKKIECENENNTELMRFFFMNGYQILIEQILQKFTGLTISEFENLTGMICVNEREKLDSLLRKEANLYFAHHIPALKTFSFLQDKLNSETVGFIEIIGEPKGEDISSGIQKFSLLKPNLHLWVYAKPFATAGSLEYDFQKLLKDVGHRKEEVKAGAFTSESGLNEHNFLFLDNYEPDNELELDFNMDTIREELDTFVLSKGFEILGGRNSKTSRMLILKRLESGIDTKRQAEKG